MKYQYVWLWAALVLIGCDSDSEREGSTCRRLTACPEGSVCRGDLCIFPATDASVATDGGASNDASTDAGQASPDASGMMCAPSTCESLFRYFTGDDYDGDGIADGQDNCLRVANPSQTDTDGDGFGEACDLCPSVSEPALADVDGDGLGDACDSDLDNDGLQGNLDSCPRVANPANQDTDMDGRGNACDDDHDNDGVLNSFDNCPLISNPNQEPPVEPVVCDTDTDFDGVPDSIDNCFAVTNFEQSDQDVDEVGDACDPDIDGDGTINTQDNCPRTANSNQLDEDRDRVGDACDDRFCFVVDPDRPADCLTPTGPLQVLTGPDAVVRVGQALGLHIFANRQDDLNYQWRVMTAPAASEPQLTLDTGRVEMPESFEYRYVSNQISTFIPDQPGVYRLELLVSINAETAVDEMSVEVLADCVCSD